MHTGADKVYLGAKRNVLVFFFLYMSLYLYVTLGYILS